jgi:glycosyltransferase involved in cell wall biosynthesis
LIIVENLPVPLDARVWQEATTLRKAGYTVSVICPTGKGHEERYIEIGGIAIYRYPLPHEGSGPLGYLLEYGTALWAWLKLSIRAYKERGFDVIQACNPPDLIFIIGLFFKLLLGTRFVFDHHDINPELYIAKFGRKDLFYRVICLWERLTFLSADLSISTNESYKKIAVERGGMRPEDVTVVRSGPSLERMRTMPPDPALRNGKKYIVGYLGVMGKQEGIDHLLEGVRYLVIDKNRKDIQFMLVGGGTELGAMKKLSQDLGVSAFVTFTGRAPDDLMLRVLNSADVCVNPDIYNEMNDKSTMNKVMEYMSLGKPVVQYDLTEGRYSAQEASLYAEKNNPIDLADKIALLLDNPDIRKKMGEYGRNRVVNELQWSIEGPKYLSVYEKLFPNARKAKHPGE